MFVQYIRGYSVHFRVYSTLGDIMSTSDNVYYIRGYHDACGRYPKYSGGYHAYIRGHYDACGGGGIMSALEGYYGYIFGFSAHWGFQYKGDVCFG